MELTSSNAERKLCHRPYFPTPQQPLLFFHQNENGILYNITEQCYYKIDTSFMDSKYVISGGANRDGWMVLQDCDTRGVALANLYSHAMIQLPKSELCMYRRPDPDYGLLRRNFACISSNPRDPNCYVVLVDYDHTMSFDFCKIGDTEFKMKTLTSFEEERLESMTNFDGKMYGLMNTTTLVRIDFNGNDVEFHELINDKFTYKLSSRTKYDLRMRGYITESCGEILLVAKIYLGLTTYNRPNHYPSYYPVEKIRVFKADLCARKWVEMKSIGERTIFLGCHGGIFCINSNDKNSGLRANCIYFLEDDDRNMYVFDLEDNSVSVNLPCSHVRKRELTSLWML
ncbi:unnamed protein product [Cuscuta epithymum]|uniref:KIB1-4 beta-propeller domain-containing protein n=1 Tax=Cuscuta epithymum TaxID=186058 RepID=A0AAV0GB83_9ASTE|nr:unnamed protein product [Cuscuta epithymum]